MRKRGIIFDFDGVIANTYRPHLAIRMVTLLGFTVHEDSHELLRQHWGMKTTELIMTCFRLTETDAELVNQEWERHDRENTGGIPFVEGICETVKQLADNGYVMAIVTNRHRESLIRLLEEWGIRLCFLNLTAREDMGEHPKPHPEAFRNALGAFRAFNISKDEVVFVGDTIVDKEAGERAGIDTILVETGPYPDVHRDSHPHAEHLVIPSATHLPRWLLWALNGFERIPAE